MTERVLDLVAPLAHEATAMRIADTAGRSRARSGAVSPPIGRSLRQASHSHADRAQLSNILRRRGHCIAGDLTKTFRRSSAQETS